ncbi:hypothetical protein VB10N_11930 [Vibrio sp. 10N]|nr:hypothetical protein VB10N_11930 [Vibrio sp. 10N]
MHLFLQTYPIGTKVCFSDSWTGIRTIAKATFKGMQERYVWEEGEVDIHVRFSDGTGSFCVVRNDGTLNWSLRPLPTHEERVNRAKRKAGDIATLVLTRIIQVALILLFLYGLNTCVGSNGSNAPDYCVPRVEC